jgi:LysM repeat protein
MKRSTYAILGLLLVIVTVVYFVTQPTETEEVTYTTPDIQLTLDPAKIVKIEITRDKRYMRLERIVGMWKVTVPVNYDADDEAIQKLLDGMAKFRIMGLASSNPEKQGLFQVNEQGTTVVFTNEEGKTTSVVVGKPAPTANQAFVRPLPSTSVYVAQGLVPDLVNKGLRDWRQRTIYRTQPQKVSLISIRSGGEKHVLKRTGWKWTSEEKTVPSDLMSAVLTELSYVRADDFVDTALIITSAPKMQVEVLSDELVRMDFYAQPGSGQYFLKTSGSQSIFVVDRELVQGMQDIVSELSAPPPVATREPAPQPQRVQATREQEWRPQPTTPTQTYQPQIGEIEEAGVLTIHTVKRGETLASIARQYGATIEQIKKWNLLERESVSPGTELYVFVPKRR